MVMTHNAAPRTSILGLAAAALVLATGAFVMPGLACPPEEQAKAKSTGGQTRTLTTFTPQARPSATPAPDTVTFFGEAPALDAMRGQTPTPPDAPEPPEPARPAKAPKAPKPPKTPRPPVAAFAPAMPSQPFGQTSAAVVDLESLKEGRTAREYPMSEGKLQCFWNMMRRDDVPILVELGDEHITIWGNDAEHEVFAKFVQIIEGKPGSNPLVAIAANGQPFAVTRAEEVPALARLGVLAGVEADRAKVAQGLALERAAKARADAAQARDQAVRERDQAAMRYRAAQDERQELERAAEALRDHARSLQDSSRTTEQRMRELERQIRVMEERAKKLERQLEDAQDRPKSRRSSQNSETEESAKSAPANLYETLLQSLRSGPAV